MRHRANRPLTPQEQDRLEAATAKRERQIELDLEQLLRDKSGRRVLHWVIFDVAGLQVIGFNRAIKDGECAKAHMVFSEGRRSVGADIHNILSGLSIGQVAKMIDEHAREAQEIQSVLIAGDKHE